MVRGSKMRWIRGRGRCEGWDECRVENRGDPCI